MPCSNPTSELAPVHPTQERPDHAQRRRFSLGQPNPAADPNPHWWPGHHRRTDPPRRHTVNHACILTATTDNPTTPLTTVRYQPLPLTIQRPDAYPVPMWNPAGAT